MAIPFLVLLLLLGLESAKALTSTVSIHTTSSVEFQKKCSEIEGAQLKLAQLESALEKSNQELNAKSLHVEQCERKIEEILVETELLKTYLASFKDNTSHANEKLSALEEELQLLWSISRKNNFELHKLEYRAQDAEKRLNVVTSQVEKMAEIVSEQWIQIQQLEQAVQMTQVRALKVKRQLSAGTCPFVKLVRSLLGGHLETLKAILDRYVASGRSVLEKVRHYLKKTFSVAKYYHHQLQGYIRKSMLRNEFTAVLANEEVVFFVASALITFPLLSVCMLVSLRFS